MTRPDLDAILSRANAATPGPWWRAHHATWEVEARPNQLVADCGSIGAADADATFIAHARTDIPALVAYAREMEAKIARAGTFHVRPPSIDNLRPVTVERVKQLDGSELWAVRRTGDVLSCRGVWEYEPIPSERTPEFLSEFRFDTFDAAWSAALRADAAMRAASEAS